MTMRKYTTSEGLEVLRGEEAQVLHEHREKLGKTKVSDFTDKQREALEADLEAVREKASSASDQSDESVDQDELAEEA